MSTESEAELARSLDRRAVVADQAGDVESAGLFFSEALAIRRTLAESDSTQRPELAMALRNMGVFWQKRGDRHESIRFLRESAELYGELAQARPEPFTAEFAKTSAMAAHLLKDMGEAEVAEAAFTDAISSYRSLSKAFPLDHARRFGYALRDYAALLADQGREDESARALEGALGVYRLAKDDPRAVAGAIATLDMQAVAHVKAGRREQAAVKLREFLAEVAVLPADQAARWLERAREAERVLAQLES